MASREDLERLTVPALKALCKERSITGVSKAKKEVLVARLLGGPSEGIAAQPASAATTARRTGGTAGKAESQALTRDEQLGQQGVVRGGGGQGGSAGAGSRGPSAGVGEEHRTVEAAGEIGHVVQQVPEPSTADTCMARAGEAVRPMTVRTESDSTSAPTNHARFATVQTPVAVAPPTTAQVARVQLDAADLTAPDISAITAPALTAKKTTAARDRKRPPAPGKRSQAAQPGAKRVKLAPKELTLAPAASGECLTSASAPFSDYAPSSAQNKQPAKGGSTAGPAHPPRKRVATVFKPLVRVTQATVTPAADCPLSNGEVSLPNTLADIRLALSRSWLARACSHITQQTARGGNKSASADPLALLFSGAFLEDRLVSAAQLQVAIRFATARMHTSFQMENYEDILRPLVITAVAPALDQYRSADTPSPSGEVEVWEVTTRGKRAATPLDAKGPRRISSSSSHAETREVKVVHLVIGATGDVVASRREVQASAGKGASTTSRMLQSQTSIALPVDPEASFAVRWLGAEAAHGGATSREQWQRGLRDDWATYLTAQPTPAPLLRMVRTKEGEQYPSGIARVWSARALEGQMAQEMAVAERYILSNAALNSVSGEYLSTAQMDAERLGQPLPDVRPKKPSVAFYLPESHHVESVSLSVKHNGQPSPLHPAIAAIARQSATDLVLRDTGQVIGCEEGDGISELWQALLGCDAKGVALPDEQAEATAERFWEGYQAEM